MALVNPAALISGAIVVLAAISLFVSLLEVFLNDAQKATINDHPHRLWNWLDDLKTRGLLNWLQVRALWLLGMGGLLAAAFVLWAEFAALRTGPFGMMVIVIACVIFGPGIFFGFKISRWILRATTLLWAVARATCFVFFAIIPFALFVLISLVFILPNLPYITTSTPTLWIALGRLLIVIAYITSVFFAALAFTFWCPVAIPLILIYIASALISASEFAVRKLAEYPRGPLVAILIVAGALVVFLRAIH